MELRSQGFSRASWVARCLALCIPFTAILHNAFFYRGTCILNLIAVDQPDYDFPALLKLFQKDPSIWFAICLALVVFGVGLRPRFALLRESVSIFLLASIPISLWIWDIPFAGQPICRCCHDLRFSLPVLGPIRSRTVYLLCIGLFVSLAAARLWVNQMRSKGARNATV